MGNSSSSANIPMNQSYGTSGSIYNNTSKNVSYNRPMRKRRTHHRSYSGRVTSMMARNGNSQEPYTRARGEGATIINIPQTQYAGKRRVKKQNKTKKYKAKH